MTLVNNDQLVSEACEICGKPVYAGQGFNGLTLNHFSCKKKVTLTKQNKAEYEQKLTHSFGELRLHCDGYDVTLQVQQDKMKLVVSTYVNGFFKGEWMGLGEKRDHPESKFLNKRTVRAYSPKKKADLIKKFGKRRAYELFDLDHEKSYYTSTWSNGKTAINHLLKVCKSVEVYE